MQNLLQQLTFICIYYSRRNHDGFQQLGLSVSFSIKFSFIESADANLVGKVFMLENHFYFTGFLSWDKDSCHVDLEKELQALVAQAPEGEEARNGEHPSPESIEFLIGRNSLITI